VTRLSFTRIFAATLRSVLGFTEVREHSVPVTVTGSRRLKFWGRWRISMLSTAGHTLCMRRRNAYALRFAVALFEDSRGRCSGRKNYLLIGCLFNDVVSIYHRVI